MINEINVHIVLRVHAILHSSSKTSFTTGEMGRIGTKKRSLVTVKKAYDVELRDTGLRITGTF